MARDAVGEYLDRVGTSKYAGYLAGSGP